jgi:(2Fe-2S) ferredoxin
MSAVSAAVDVLVCRGCCCGSADKRPGFDHAGQLAAVTEALDGVPGARLVVTECLGPCEQANVVVVRTHGRSTDGRRSAPVWFGNVLGDSRTAALCAWAGEIGRTAGQLPPPGPVLDSLRIPAPGPRRTTRTGTT